MKSFSNYKAYESGDISVGLNYDTLELAKAGDRPFIIEQGDEMIDISVEQAHFLIDKLKLMILELTSESQLIPFDELIKMAQDGQISVKQLKEYVQKKE